MRDTDFVDIKPLKDFREHDNHMLNIVIEMEKFNAWRYAFFLSMLLQLLMLLLLHHFSLHQ